MKRNCFGQKVFLQPTTPCHESTPIRKSLANIKKNSVAGMVELFSQPIKLLKTDDESLENESKLSPQLPSGVNKHVAFFNEISAIGQRSDSVESMDLDSGYGDSDFRIRSQSVSASSLNNTSMRPSNIIEAYKKYPNFKLEYLKYFAVNPREFLSQYGCGVDVIDSVLTKDDNDDLRKRSKSFGTKTVLWSANVIVNRETTLRSNQFEHDSSEDIGSSQTLEPLSGHSDIRPQESILESSDSNAAEKSQTKGVNDSLKSRIKKSIESYDNLVKSITSKNANVDRKKSQKKRKLMKETQ
ncbi:hypothetical protein Bhyg_11488 [Pseudolycoriella hygida]|uniref:Uncharacterized protein n=1 Tax=Pseudolycoriella hygida TaxID=35572 RepID=A0A9Q0MX98_9DIPT|nr:hypothetical protein Bhyg_11488 [Pseudolycoriella hygida]